MTMNEMKTVNEIRKPDENYHLVKRKPSPSRLFMIDTIFREREKDRKENFIKYPFSSVFLDKKSWIRRIIIRGKLSRGLLFIFHRSRTVFQPEPTPKLVKKTPHT